MDCPRCHQGVPDESVFCLHCGTRVTPATRLAPTNGGGTAQPAAGATPGSAPAAAPPVPPPQPGQKQAYALSFKALSDERLRYRVARWVCELAPAHGLAEIQEDLVRGEFATFLALTPEEAAEARQRVLALGVHPALVRLEPATQAELLLPRRNKPDEDGASKWTPAQKFAAVAIFVLVFFVFGIVVLYKYG